MPVPTLTKRMIAFFIFYDMKIIGVWFHHLEKNVEGGKAVEIYGASSWALQYCPKMTGQDLSRAGHYSAI